jgi:hypothetical protein
MPIGCGRTGDYPKVGRFRKIGIDLTFVQTIFIFSCFLSLQKSIFRQGSHFFFCSKFLQNFVRTRELTYFGVITSPGEGQRMGPDLFKLVQDSTGCRENSFSILSTHILKEVVMNQVTRTSQTLGKTYIKGMVCFQR